MHACILHSFIPSFLHSFIHSFIHPFTHSFIHLSIHLSIHLFLHSFFPSFIQLFIPCFFPSFVHSCIDCFFQFIQPLCIDFFHVISLASQQQFARPIRWCKSQPQHFIASASPRHSYSHRFFYRHVSVPKLPPQHDGAPLAILWTNQKKTATESTKQWNQKNYRRRHLHHRMV